MFSVPTAVAGHVKSGKLRALAYTGDKPVPGLDVPNFAQAGLPGFDINSWNGIFVAAGTPEAAVDKLSAEIARILTLPDVKERLAAQGQEPHYLNPEQFAALRSRRDGPGAHPALNAGSGPNGLPKSRSPTGRPMASCGTPSTRRFGWTSGRTRSFGKSRHLGRPGSGAPPESKFKRHQPPRRNLARKTSRSTVYQAVGRRPSAHDQGRQGSPRL
jgi:hypothetical protein